jgi:hypothetical protein
MEDATMPRNPGARRRVEQQWPHQERAAAGNPADDRGFHTPQFALSGLSK